MRKYLLSAVSMAFFGLALIASSPVWAQTASTTTIGVVDVQEIIQKSKVAKNIKSQLDEKLKSYQGEVSKLEEKLRADDQDLMKQRSILKPEEIATKRRALQEQAVKVQQNVEQKKRSLDAGFGKAMATIMDKVRNIVETIAKERGLSMVISKQQVIYTQAQLDLTSEVLGALDKELTSLKVDFSTPKAPATSGGK